jgi:hypothetical protein
LRLHPHVGDSFEMSANIFAGFSYPPPAERVVVTMAAFLPRVPFAGSSGGQSQPCPSHQTTQPNSNVGLAGPFGACGPSVPGLTDSRPFRVFGKPRSQARGIRPFLVLVPDTFETEPKLRDRQVHRKVGVLRPKAQKRLEFHFAAVSCCARH